MYYCYHNDSNSIGDCLGASGLVGFASAAGDCSDP